MAELLVSVIAVIAVILGSLWWVSMSAEEPPFASLAAPRHARRRRLPRRWRRWRRWLLAVVDVAIVVVLAALVWLLLLTGHG